MEKLQRWKMAEMWIEEVKRAFVQMVEGKELERAKNCGWFKACESEIYSALSSSFNLKMVEEAQATLSTTLEGLRRFRELLLAVKPEVKFQLWAGCYESRISVYHDLSVEVRIAVYGKVQEELKLTKFKEWDCFEELIKFLNRLEAVLSQFHIRGDERIKWLKEPISSYEEIVEKPKERRRVPKVALVGGEK